MKVINESRFPNELIVFFLRDISSKVVLSKKGLIVYLKHARSIRCSGQFSPSQILVKYGEMFDCNGLIILRVPCPVRFNDLGLVFLHELGHFADWSADKITFERNKKSITESSANAFARIHGYPELDRNKGEFLTREVTKMVLQKLNNIVRDHEGKKRMKGTKSSMRKKDEYVSSWVKDEVTKLINSLDPGDTKALRDFTQELISQLSSYKIDKRKVRNQLALYIRNEFKKQGGRIVKVGTNALLTK